MTETLVVLGRSGQAARRIAALCEARGLACRRIGRDRLDLSRATSAQLAALTDGAWAVINAAAWTAVDAAESDPEAARTLNADLPGRMARVCADRDLPFIHLSTDYVFPGDDRAPFGEDAPTDPLGVYGETKAEGEMAVRGAGGRWTLVRTSWVHDSTGSNFVTTMLDLARERDEISVVADQLGRPTFAADLAEAVLAVAKTARVRPQGLGVLHATSEGETSWAGLAEAVFDGSRRRGGPGATVRPISTAEFGAAAPRPADSRLAYGRIEALTGWRRRDWRAALDACLDERFGLVSPAR